MKLGVHIGYWGLGLTREDQLEIVQEAERLGYDSVWTAEAYGSDAATVLGWLAGQTERIKIGSAIFQMPGRIAGDDRDDRGDARPALRRAHAAGHRLVAARRSPRAGTACASPSSCSARASTSTVVRMALARERVEYHGETLELPLPDGPGKALKLTIAPVQERIPIYLAAIGPKNTALAGEIADGWIPTLFSPEHVPELRPSLEEGAARAGRSLDGFDIAPTVNVFVTDDLEAARDAMRPFLALYVGGMGSREQNFYNQLVQRYGFEDAAREVQDLYLEGKKDEAMAALPDELIDTRLALRPHGRRARAAARLPRRRRRHARRHADGLRRRRSASTQLRLRRRAAGRGRLRVLLGAFGDPGHAFPMHRAGARAARARGHEVAAGDLEALGARRRARGACGSRRRPSTTVFPTPGAAAEALRGGRARAARRRARCVAASRPTSSSPTS